MFVPRMEPLGLVIHIRHKPPFPGDGDRPPWRLMHLPHTTLMEEMMTSNRFYSFQRKMWNFAILSVANRSKLPRCILPRMLCLMLLIIVRPLCCISWLQNHLLCCIYQDDRDRMAECVWHQPAVCESLQVSTTTPRVMGKERVKPVFPSGKTVAKHRFGQNAIPS